MIARNYQQVGGRLRIDVANHDAAFVAVNEFRRDFARDDLAKKTVRFSHINCLSDSY